MVTQYTHTIMEVKGIRVGCAGTLLSRLPHWRAWYLACATAPRLMQRPRATSEELMVRSPSVATAK